MVQYRDILLKREDRQTKKQDKLPIKRAVLTNEGGLQSTIEPLEDVWANRDERRVWYMTDGAVQPGQILCRQISDPYVGLGVNIGYVDGNNEIEVLRDDFFLTRTGDPTAWASTAPRDNEPGGRKLLWLYPKSLIPLAVYPEPTGLVVNVIGGDYPYDGNRVTFAGFLNLELTQNPNAGQHYLAGIYLDSSNVLQVEYGASVSTTFNAPEPVWPAGAFQLSVVLIDDVQTSIDFDTDIFDRRMLWSDENGGGSSWKLGNTYVVSSSGDGDFTTITAAYAFVEAIGNPANILLDKGEYDTGVGGLENLLNDLSIIGLDPENTIIYNDDNDTATLINSAGGLKLFNLTVEARGAGTQCYAMSSSGDSLIISGCNILKTIGAANLNIGLQLTNGDGIEIINTKIIGSNGAITSYGLQNINGDINARITNGYISGTTQDIYGDISGSKIQTLNTVLAYGKVDFLGSYPRTDIAPTPTEPIIINGHPLIWQRGTSFAAIASGAYFADKFRYDKVGAMVHTVSQSNDVPTVAQIGCLLNYSMLIDCTTVDSSIAAGDLTIASFTMEGYDFLKIAQQQFTLGFWIKATKTGVYCVAFRNSGRDRSYVAEITVNATATWEYKQVTVPASPSAGTWNYTNGLGMDICLTLASGSTFQTTANAWQTGNYIATANQVNACDNTANDVRIVWGDVTPGLYARPIVANPFGSIQTLLARCQRYYCKSYELGTAPATATVVGVYEFNTRTAIAGSVAGTLRFSIPFPQPMRVAPTSSALYSFSTGASGAVRNASAGTDRTGATMEAASLSENGMAAIDITNASANAIALDALIVVHYTAHADF